MLTLFINEIAAQSVGSPYVLVLDDYHVIEAPPFMRVFPACSSTCRTTCVWSLRRGPTRPCRWLGCASFIRTFTGSHRYIMDYLVDEVLQRQPDHIQTFLLQTAILERLSGPLCEAITGQEHGQATLGFFAGPPKKVQ